MRVLLVFILFFILYPLQGSCVSLDEAKQAYQQSDFDRAFHLFQQLAEKGDRNAQYELGAMYDAGEGVKRDLDLAYKWFLKAANQNHPEAQFNVAQMLESGEGVRKDSSKAAVWYQKSADQGNASAQNNLGDYYRAGMAVGQDLEKAFTLYQRAAEQGNPQAQLNLGVMLFEDKGIDPDYLESYKWLTLAVEGFSANPTEQYQKAQKIFMLLQSLMTESQIIASKERINQWKSKSRN